MVLTNKQLQKTLDEIEWLKKYYNKHFAVEAKQPTSRYDKKRAQRCKLLSSA